MARPSSNHTPRDLQLPVYLFDEEQVNQAWKAYRATQLACMSDPSLLTNPYHMAIQDTAYARFLALFERMAR